MSTHRHTAVAYSVAEFCSGNIGKYLHSEINCNKQTYLIKAQRKIPLEGNKKQGQKIVYYCLGHVADICRIFCLPESQLHRSASLLFCFFQARNNSVTAAKVLYYADILIARAFKYFRNGFTLLIAYLKCQQTAVL